MSISAMLKTEQNPLNGSLFKQHLRTAVINKETFDEIKMKFSELKNEVTTHLETVQTAMGEQDKKIEDLQSGVLQNQKLFVTFTQFEDSMKELSETLEQYIYNQTPRTNPENDEKIAALEARIKHLEDKLSEDLKPSTSSNVPPIVFKKFVRQDTKK